MLSLNIKGTLGKLGYVDIPEDITDIMLKAAIDKAYLTAFQRAPFDPEHPIHIKEELKKYYSKSLNGGAVWVKLPYANLAEYGSKSRLMNPFMRPAAKDARVLIKAIAKSAIKLAIKNAQEKAGI